ncbi:branched-chain amino acid ABC transporter ATP-binding protein/permease [Streptosporangium saharense]|uniref:branched-chain amino acid ABC transporter ATP-binding protein/permease n=1 Tax=Streptosporangium saharense TaxID=1706840 RepID=UPI0036C9CA3F
MKMPTSPWFRYGVPVPAAVIVAVPLAMVLTDYWVFTVTGAAIVVIMMQSFGVITGRAGVISLCQFSFMGIGAWTTSWLGVHGAPGGFVVWAVLGALAVVPVGLVVGIPALRLRGVSLAIATFAFAVTMDVVFASGSFPGQDELLIVERPAGLDSDAGYAVLVVGITVALFVALAVLDRTRLGASWVEVRTSERAAAAHGTSVTLSKLAAFSVSAFLAGLAGALLVGQLGTVTAQNFAAQQSLVMFGIAISIGVHRPEGAVIGGVVGTLLPVGLDALGLPQDVGTIVVGLFAVYMLRQGGGEFGQTDIIRAKRNAKKLRERSSEKAEQVEQVVETGRELGEVVLRVSGLTVRFGEVVAVNGADLEVRRGEVLALLGPNGAGKSTFIDAVTGFAHGYTGTVHLDGRPVDRLSAHRRARLGLRRSFQQLTVAADLDVGMLVRAVAGRKLSASEVDEILAHFRCPPARTPVGTLDVGARRLVEVAGLVASRPRVLLLDEPAAGQSASESEALARRIAGIPALTGGCVILVEHDIELVRATADRLVVMDFGEVLASGTPQEVLSDERVVAAYLGRTASGQHPQPT